VRILKEVSIENSAREVKRDEESYRHSKLIDLIVFGSPLSQPGTKWSKGEISRMLKLRGSHWEDSSVRMGIDSSKRGFESFSILRKVKEAGSCLKDSILSIGTPVPVLTIRFSRFLGNKLICVSSKQTLWFRIFNLFKE
jgi:hypothetical protein